jgi:site-specific recombinase XerD
MRPIVGAIKFFFRVTVVRDWPTLQAIRLPKSDTVPLVMVPQRCWQLIDATDKLYLRVFLRTAYTCGLRVGDTRHLRPEDVDSDRMMLRVCTTKGLHEREVPIPVSTLEALRTYWTEHRNPRWLFPSRASLKQIGEADRPISERSVQRGLQQVAASLGWKQSGLCVHTLRHSYATAMLEAGVNLKVLQTYLGHKNIEATEIYLHMTRGSNQAAQKIVQSIMNGPSADAPQPPDQPHSEPAERS